MASHSLSTRATGSDATVQRYLEDLSARLRGPRAARRRVLAEVADGLTETIDAYAADGLPPDLAATTAIREFGDPATVAESFAGELATSTARRTTAAFIATGPLVGIWWLLLLQPAPWRSGFAALLIAIPALPLIAVAIGASAAIIATTGRLMRWLPETTPARARRASAVIAALCVLADLTVIGVLAAHLATGRSYPIALAVIAVTASSARIGVAVAVIRSTRTRGHRAGVAAR